MSRDHQQIFEVCFVQNPSYSSTIGIQPHQTAFNSQAREFTPMMVNQTNMNNPGSKVLVSKPIFAIFIYF